MAMAISVFKILKTIEIILITSNIIIFLFYFNIFTHILSLPFCSWRCRSKINQRSQTFANNDGLPVAALATGPGGPGALAQVLAGALK